MKMLSENRQLVDKWEATDMVEEGCRCGCVEGAEAPLHLEDLHPPHLSQRRTRRAWMAQFAAVLALLLVSALVAVVLLVAFERPCQTAPHCQTTKQPEIPPTGAIKNQPQVGAPSHQVVRARLTASSDSATEGDYIRWQSKLGYAYCYGFNCSNVDVVVPRNGFYRVLLQITYEGVATGAPVILQPCVHYIHSSYPEKKCILSSHDMPPSNTGTWVKSIHTSGTFELEANGVLQVKSAFRSLNLNEHLTFFEVELLPSP